MKRQKITDLLTDDMVEPIMTYALRYVIGKSRYSSGTVRKAIEATLPVVSDSELWAWERTISDELYFAERVHVYTGDSVYFDGEDEEKAWRELLDKISAEVERREKRRLKEE